MLPYQPKCPSHIFQIWLLSSSFYSYFIYFSSLVSGTTNVALQVWDIGGQTLGGSMLNNYIFGAHVSDLITNISMDGHVRETRVKIPCFNYQSFKSV